MCQYPTFRSSYDRRNRFEPGPVEQVDTLEEAPLRTSLLAKQ
jgi:hypothetical protein